MKIALYIQDGVTQIVLTPENDFEKSVVGKLATGVKATVKRGSFFKCQGGWYRYDEDSADDSVMFVLDGDTIGAA